MINIKFSRLGLLSTTFFVIYVAVFRILLPYGDEPDFVEKATQVKYGETISIMSLAPDHVLDGLITDESCEINSSPFTLAVSWSNSSCEEPLEQIAFRLLTTFITFIPIFLILIFKNQISSVVYKNDSGHQQWMAKYRIDGLIVSMPFSGYVYYAGLISNEQLTLMLSTAVIIFIDKKDIVALLITTVLAIDFGNGIVVLYFFVSFFLLTFLRLRFGKRWAYLIASSAVLVFIAQGVSILQLVPGDLGQLGDKAIAMHEAMTEGNQAEKLDKYPIILRPALTFLTFILYTPNYVKAPAAYVFFFAATLLAILTRKQPDVKFSPDTAVDLEVMLASMLFVILTITFAFPTYANGKYYIFGLPILFFPIIERIGRIKTFLLSAATSFVVSLNLSFFTFNL